VSSRVSPITSDIAEVSGSSGSRRRSRSLRYCRRRKELLAVGSGNSKTFNLLHCRLQRLPLMSAINTKGVLVTDENALNV